MRIEGVPDEKTEKLRKKFVALYKNMEDVVRAETAVLGQTEEETQEAGAGEPHQHTEKVLKYKNGRPYFECE